MVLFFLYDSAVAHTCHISLCMRFTYICKSEGRAGCEKIEYEWIKSQLVVKSLDVAEKYSIRENVKMEHLQWIVFIHINFALNPFSVRISDFQPTEKRKRRNISKQPSNRQKQPQWRRRRCRRQRQHHHHHQYQCDMRSRCQQECENCLYVNSTIL